MPGAHRDRDERFCGAETIVIGQSSVFVNGKLWAVEDDPEDHGAGELVQVVPPSNVKAEGKLVICAIGDEALADNFPHNPPLTYPVQRSPNVFVYGA
jgi:hypothetical protein